MAMPLKKLLERECELHYYMHLSQHDIDKMDVSELMFKSSWLVERKKAEAEIEKLVRGN